ncbi:hypothetical protein [Cupriavidus sp. WS]|uniref:hypothetical protein n=1 Tax=Cupriavidus sp. WS TaxID=1312922 RepID=UPI0012DF2B5F|nr:hypothetical protein [Cupriavidus sp. WS]
MFKNLYARLVLWLIAPALVEHHRRASEAERNDDVAVIRSVLASVSRRGCSTSELQKVRISLETELAIVRAHNGRWQLGKDGRLRFDGLPDAGQGGRDEL